MRPVICFAQAVLRLFSSWVNCRSVGLVPVVVRMRRRAR